MIENQLKKESNTLALLYMQLIYRLFREQEDFFCLYLINLFSIILASANTDEISEAVDSGDINCKNEALNENKTAKFCSGLYYFNARWYDPMLGRFTTEDPIRDGLNWYAYANNNPLRFVDPTGLMDVIYSDSSGVNLDYPVYNSHHPLNQKSFDLMFGFGDGKTSESCYSASIVNSYNGIRKDALIDAVKKGKDEGWFAEDGSPKAINKFSEELAKEQGLDKFNSLVYSADDGWENPVSMPLEEALNSDYKIGIATLEKPEYTHHVAGFKGDEEPYYVDSLESDRVGVSTPPFLQFSTGAHIGASDYTLTEVEPMIEIPISNE